MVEVTQRRRGYFDPDKQIEMDRRKKISRSEDGDFVYRAGSTFFLDPNELEIGWVIKTPGTIASNEELNRMRRHLTGEYQTPDNAFDSLQFSSGSDEPFAMLHDHEG